MELLNKILKTIQKYHLISSGETVVLGVSGGADSMAMLYLLDELKPDLQCKFVVAHLNHMTRGKDSDDDVSFVEKHAQVLNLPFVVEKKDIRALSQSENLCLEDGAREARYEFFRQVANSYKAKKIAVAHTQDDQAETFFLRILRGAGTTGLGAMKLLRPLGEESLIRPLLQISRRELVEYLRERGIGWREDSSNQDLHFTRNKIRNLVLPLLKKEFNPGIVDTLCRTSGILSAEDFFLNQEVTKIFQEVVQEEENGFSISIDSLKGMPQALQRRLLRMMYFSVGGSDGLSFGQSEDILFFIEEAQSGRKMELPRRIELWREYGRLFMGTRFSEGLWLEKNIQIPGEAIFLRGDFQYKIIAKRYLRKRERIFSKNRTGFADYEHLLSEGGRIERCEYFDADQIKDSFVVRGRQSGDQYDPIGLRVFKKVKNIFIDEKVPVRFRSLVPFFVCREKIFWIGGYRISESFKVKEETKNILEVRLTVGGKGNA